MPTCIRCKTSVPDDEAHSVSIIKPGGKTIVFACDTHRPMIDVTVNVTRAVVRAGFEAALETRAPGLLGRVQRALSALRGE